MLNTAHACHVCLNYRGPWVCPQDAAPIAVHIKAADCPRGLHAGLAAPAAGQSSSPATVDLWAWLHCRPFAPDLDLATEPHRLAGWMALVPCGECKMEVTAFVEVDPPDLTDPLAYFAWSVRFHNHVNAKLGRPQWSITQAEQKWRTADQ